MKPGKIGASLVVCLLAGTVFVQTMKLSEIPKLEQRVDELVKSVEVMDAELQAKTDTMDSMKEAHTKALQKQKELFEAEALKKDEEHDEELRKVIKAKDTRINELEKKLQPVATVSRGQSYREVSTVGNFEVTWYNYNSGYTASGVPPRDGITVSVDPNVIPLGTWVKLTFPDGTELIRKAEDTGSAVKGHILDVYSTKSTSTLLKWGRTHGVKVTIIKKL